MGFGAYCCSAQQFAERFDNLTMIENEAWIEKSRKTILENVGNIHEYGCLIVKVSGEEPRVSWILGLHQNIIQDGHFDKASDGDYSIRLYDVTSSKKSLASISESDYIRDVKFFWSITVEAGVNKMPSKTNADINYYVFSRNIVSTERTAVGLFSSCVLIAPSPENEHLTKIQQVLQQVMNKSGQ